MMEEIKLKKMLLKGKDQWGNCVG